MTNGEKIRESNESLEAFLSFYRWNCSACPPGEIDSDGSCSNPTQPCKVCWLDWLNAEAEEDKDDKWREIKSSK